MLIGNITRDIELRYTPGGAAVAEFGLAVNRKYKQGDEMKEEVLFIDVTAWGKMGENISQYMSKGRSIFIEGYLVLDQWESKEGEKRSKIKCTALNCQFLGDASGGGGGGGGGGQRQEGGGQRQSGGGQQQTRGGGGGGGQQTRGGQADDDMNLDNVPF